MADEKFQLLPFQDEAVQKTLEAIALYNGARNPFTSGRMIPAELEGEPKPYLHRIKAVTGAGKTPILAAIAARLGDCIILWTTPRGAVIEQTTANLKGRYRSLLPGDCEVLTIDEAMTGGKWNNMVEDETGCTIITMTVSSFNQSKESSALRIHKGESSPWNQLAVEKRRPLWVFYDEGHNATENQFARLFELQPKGFLMASASPLSADLWVLVPGEDKEAQEKVFNEKRTTKIDTAAVVEAGLLKRKIEIHDLSAAEEDVLAAAYKKRKYLDSICGDENGVIACYIVDRESGATGAQHGLRIWEKLIGLGADPKSIAVHLNGAKKAAEIQAVTKPIFDKLVATYDEKVGPEELKSRGFRHLIWNLSLEEGWDEPWAYVGYFHGQQHSEIKVTQRIGRLLRNPFKDDEGLPALAGEPALETVYCYLNAEEGILTEVVSHLRREMETAAADVAVIKSHKDDLATEFVSAKRRLTIPRLYLSVDSKKMERDLVEMNLFRTTIADEDCHAKGVEVKRVIDISDSSVQSSEKKLNSNMPATVARIVYDYLEMKDWRLVRARGSVGGWLHNRIWERKEMQKLVAYTSKAHDELKVRCDDFLEKLEEYIMPNNEDLDGAYAVADFPLINPDGGDTDAKLTYYKAHGFVNAAHEKYNGLNKPELDMARAIDALGVPWVRNKDRIGYGIPLVRPSGSSTHFYPDFIVWPNGEGKKVVFVEAKGGHLLEQAKKEKLIILPADMGLGFITEDKGSFKLVRLINGKPSEDTGSLSEMVKKLVEQR